MYHRLLLDGYLQYLVIKRKLGEPVPAENLSRIRAQLAFMNVMTSPTGHVPLIGDSDDHKFLRLETSRYDDVTPTLYLGSLLFPQKPSFEPACCMWG